MLAYVVAALPYAVHAQSAKPASDAGVVSLDAIKVEASADASAGGLAQPYAGGQVARGGRVGVLGTQDIMSTPFSITVMRAGFVTVLPEKCGARKTIS